MLLPRVVKDVFLCYSEYSTVKTLLSIKTKTSSESGEISKERSRRPSQTR